MNRARLFVIVGTFTACSAAAPFHSTPGDAAATSPLPSTTDEADLNQARVDAANDQGTPTTLRELCFANLPSLPPGAVEPNYDQFHPTYGSHCQGTNQQDIKNVQKVVFLGDSITAGTPPTPLDQFYRSILLDDLQKKFGANIEVSSCAAWGANVNDLLVSSSTSQLSLCFPFLPEQKTTLVIMTDGGNDVNRWRNQSAQGVDDATILAGMDNNVQQLRNAIAWIKDPSKFPKGSYLIYGNLYEFTDGTGDTNSCPVAALAGLKPPGPSFPAEFVHFNEQFVKAAVDYQVDVIFMLEQFCGHGYHHDDPTTLCFRGPGAPLWFDLTCIHPNPIGHAKLADMFMDVVNE